MVDRVVVSQLTPGDLRLRRVLTTTTMLMDLALAVALILARVPAPLLLDEGCLLDADCLPAEGEGVCVVGLDLVSRV